MTNGNYSVVTVALMAMFVLVGAFTMPIMSSMLTNRNTDTPAYGSAETGNASVDYDCTDEILPEMHSIYSAVDIDKAKNLADQNTELQSRSQNYNRGFNSIFTEWSFDPATCGNVKLTSINVAYTLSDDVKDIKNIVVTFDPELSRIAEVSEHIAAMFYTTGTSPIWAGYEFSGNSGSTTPVYESKGNWFIPAVSEPSSGFCFFQHCDLAIWAGLEDALGATNNHLVQAGTDSGVYCTAGCSYFYWAWYEFLPSSAVQCGQTFNVGHQVVTTVTNKAKTGGSNTRYDVVITNNGNGQVCSVLNQSYTAMNSPKRAVFENERPIIQGSQARLAKFSSDQITSATMYYSGSSKSIYTPYTNGWYHKNTMMNGGQTNISVGAVGSSGQYISTWVSSNGT